MLTKLRLFLKDVVIFVKITESDESYLKAQLYLQINISTDK